MNFDDQHRTMGEQVCCPLKNFELKTLHVNFDKIGPFKLRQKTVDLANLDTDFADWGVRRIMLVDLSYGLNK
jgi:hypothetical protein